MIIIYHVGHSLMCWGVGWTVIDHLDTLKKDNAGAREAIRWLEAEFHKGNRLVQSAGISQCHITGTAIITVVIK